MNFKVSTEFEIELKRLGKKYQSLKNDYSSFLDELKANPLMGVEVFKNCRKARIAIKSKGKGKRGGGRIFFYFNISDDYITLLYIYDKSETVNIDVSVIKEILEKNL